MGHHLSKVVASKEAPASLYLACFRSCSSSNRLGGGGCASEKWRPKMLGSMGPMPANMSEF